MIIDVALMSSLQINFQFVDLMCSVQLYLVLLLHRINNYKLVIASQFSIMLAYTCLV